MKVYAKVVLGVAGIALMGGCDSPADALAEKFEMLEAAGGGRGELCDFASQAAAAYLEELERDKFIEWEARKKEVCPPPVATVFGATGYPSDYIPEDMRICAREVNTNVQKCVETNGESTYLMEVAPGDYQVWAETDAFPERGYKAYYSAAVECGFQEFCKDHSPLTITLAAGQVRRGIDPTDWYAP